MARELKKEKRTKKIDPMDIWDRYELTCKFNERLCGSVPQSKELVPIWLKSRMPKTKPLEAEEKTMEDLEQEVLESLQETEERTKLSFQKDDNGLFLRGGTFKAHLKDCANQVRETLDIAGLRSKIANKVIVEQYRIPLRRNGASLHQEDGNFEQPVHVWTPKGPQNALKVIGFVDNPEIHLTLRILKQQEITQDVLVAILEYGKWHGYGGERGMGEGRYEYELKAI